MNWTRRHSIAAGVALIAATNAIALIGAAYNRSGTPGSTLVLTQRELGVPYSRGSSENSGLAMRLQWRVLLEDLKNPAAYRWAATGWGAAPSWLDRDKMASLGFDVTVPDDPESNARRSFRHQLARDVLLVLEEDGPTYQRSLANATAAAATLKARNEKESTRLAEEILENESKTNSRLFVVDAGLDAAALRAKFPDRQRYAIVRGLVEPAGGQLARTHSGYISSLAVEAINVPLEWRPAFEGATPYVQYVDATQPRAAYEVTVEFGQRLEPWIGSAVKR